jgi:hypothetical protein
MRVPMSMLKMVTIGPALLGSAVLTPIVIALLPPPVNAVLFLASCGMVTALTMRRLEEPAVKLLTRSREATEGEWRVLRPVLIGLGGLEADVLGVYIRRTPGPTTPTAAVLGRGSLVVPPEFVGAVYRGSVTVEEAAAVIAHAVGTHRAARHRCEVAVLAATAPWRAVGAVLQAVGHACARLPLVRAAWTLRGVVGVICIVRSVGEGRAAGGLLAGAVIALTYLMPAATRALRQRIDVAGDIFVVERGLGGALAGLLRRRGYPAAIERWQRLEPRPAASV